MAQEGEAADTEAIIVEPGAESGAASPPPDADGTNLGLLVLFGVLLAGIVASNVWLRKRSEREDS